MFTDPSNQSFTSKHELDHPQDIVALENLAGDTSGSTFYRIRMFVQLGITRDNKHHWGFILQRTMSNGETVAEDGGPTGEIHEWLYDPVTLAYPMFHSINTRAHLDKDPKPFELSGPIAGFPGTLLRHVRYILSSVPRGRIQDLRNCHNYVFDVYKALFWFHQEEPRLEWLDSDGEIIAEWKKVTRNGTPRRARFLYWLYCPYQYLEHYPPEEGWDEEKLRVEVESESKKSIKPQEHIDAKKEWGTNREEWDKKRRERGAPKYVNQFERQ